MSFSKTASYDLVFFRIKIILILENLFLFVKDSITKPVASGSVLLKKPITLNLQVTEFIIGWNIDY